MKAIGFLRLAVAVALIWSVGCTRGQSATLSLNINVPDFSQQKVLNGGTIITGCVNRIMVDVAGNAPYIWNNSNGGGGANCTAPPATAWTSSSFNVTVGQSVLIQVLVLTQDDMGDMTPWYVSQPVTPVAGGNTFTLTPVQQGATIGQGQIAGRYLEAGDSVGRTGIINLLYQPAVASDPPMIVDQSEIFGGWFSVFAPVGSKFLYTFADGTPMFISGADASTLGTSDQVMMVTTPGSWRTNDNNNQANGPSVIVGGFFGPGNSGKGEAACYNMNDNEIPNVDALNATDTDSGIPLQWIADETPDSSADPQYQAYVTGGMSDGPCPSQANVALPTPLVMYMDYEMLGQNGGGGNSQIFGFSGPFAAVTASSGGNQPSFLTSNYTSQMTLSWAYITGVNANNLLSGVDVFYTTTAPASSGNPIWSGPDGNGVDCTNVAAGKWGFQLAQNGSIPISATPSITFPVSGYATTSFGAVVCPFTMASTGKKVYFNSALSMQPGNNNSTPQTPVQIVLNSDPNDTQSWGGNTQVMNICQQYDLMVEDMHGNVISNQPSLTFQLSSSVSFNGLLFYPSAAGCDGTVTNAITSITTAANAPISVSVYIYAGSPAMGLSTISITPPMTNGNSTIHFQNTSAIDFDVFSGTQLPIATEISANATANMIVNQCYPVTFDYSISGTTPASPSNTVAYTFEPFSVNTGTSGSGGNYFTEPDCDPSSQIASTATIPTGAHGLQIYFMPTVTGSTGLSASNSGSADVDQYSTLWMVAAPPTPSSASIQIDGYAVSGTLPATQACYPLNVNFNASNGAPINFSSLPTESLSLSVTGTTPGTIYTNSNGSCTGMDCCQIGEVPATGQLTFPSSGSWPQLYYLSPAAGTGTITFTANGSGLSVQSTNYNFP